MPASPIPRMNHAVSAPVESRADLTPFHGQGKGALSRSCPASVSMSFTHCHSLYGETPPQSSPNIRKNGSIPPGRTISSHKKQRGGPRTIDPYNTQTWVWKMDHPCFFDFFCWIDDGGHSRLSGGTFSLSGFVGNASRLPCDPGAFPRCDIHHSSRLAL